MADRPCDADLAPMALRQSSDFSQAKFHLEDVFTCTDDPTLIVDLQCLSSRGGVHVDFANDSFKEQYGVILRFIVSGAQTLEPGFIQWLGTSVASDNVYLLGELSWKSFIISGRWKVITVIQVPAQQSMKTSQQSDILSSDHTPNGIPSSPVTDSSPVKRDANGSPLTVSLPTGLVSLGSAPTALEGLHRSVEMLDIGFFEYDLQGTLIFANSSFYALSGHPINSDAHTELRFLDLCHPDDIAMITVAWTGLLEGKPITFDMRWKHTPTASARSLGAQWVSAACIPLYDKSGMVRSVSGCTVNINNVREMV